MLKKLCILVALSIPFAACSSDDDDSKSCTTETCPNGECVNDQCVPKSDACTSDVCKDSTTLLKCDGGKTVVQACGDNEVCENSSCKTVSTPDECTSDVCKDSTTLLKCDSGKTVVQACGDNEVCEDGSCKTVSTADECTSDVCQDSTTILTCDGGKLGATKLCGVGEVCEGGGCMTAFTIGESCDEGDGVGKCTADGQNAIVCHKGKVTRYTCKEPCQDDEETGIVDCPKKSSATTEKECNAKTYVPVCSSDRSSVQVCVKGEIQTWQCANQSCSVDAKGEITCPREVDPDALTSGGTYGDPCDGSKYQEACIDQYYALICDYDNIVRIKPAGDCKISSDNPLKVSYSTAATCNAETDYMPFCINNGQAIGFCAFTSDDTGDAVYKAAQCKGCDGEERAKECMME